MFYLLNSSLGGLSFAQNADGKWGYKVGADAVIPFSDGGIKDTTYIGGFINADSNVKYTFDKAFTGYLVFSFGSHYPAIPNIVFDNVGALCEIISYGGKGNVADGWGGAWRAGYIIYKIDIPVNTTMTCSVKVTNDAIFFTIKC